jgi:DNA-nicking Smr family endonuclease
MKKRNSDFIYDIRIDLHSLTTMQAFHKVLQTIESAHKAGVRNILFITGIGDPARGTGLIRAEFPTYIDHPSVRDVILETKYESGKYMIRLRKQK